MARRPLSDDDVARAAELHGIPPELALAIYDQESGSGRNTRTSPRGAVGGFQVTPSTFQRYMPNGNIHDPVDNMLAGLSVLKDGLAKSGGDPEGAAHFYYSGKVLRPGQEGPNSGPGTPSVRQYGRQVVNRMNGIQQARGGASTLGMSPQDSQEDLYGGTMGGPMGAAGLVQPPEAAPDIAGLTRPLDLSMNGDWLGPQSHDYELDRYVQQIVDEELGRA